jgi:hypothetical protein
MDPITLAIVILAGMGVAEALVEQKPVGEPQVHWRRMTDEQLKEMFFRRVHDWKDAERLLGHIRRVDPPTYDRIMRADWFRWYRDKVAYQSFVRELCRLKGPDERPMLNLLWERHGHDPIFRRAVRSERVRAHFQWISNQGTQASCEAERRRAASPVEAWVIQSLRPLLRQTDLEGLLKRVPGSRGRMRFAFDWQALDADKLTTLLRGATNYTQVRFLLSGASAESKAAALAHPEVRARIVALSRGERPD